MSYFIRLASYTKEGGEDIANFPKTLENAKAVMQKRGAKIVSAYATTGRYDLVALVGAQGKIRSATLATISLDAFSKAVTRG